MVLLALVILFVLGLVPLDASRNAALSLQRTLAQTLGDSFLFTDNPVTEAAVVTRVQRDLVWLGPALSPRGTGRSLPGSSGNVPGAAAPDAGKRAAHLFPPNSSPMGPVFASLPISIEERTGESRCMAGAPLCCLRACCSACGSCSCVPLLAWLLAAAALFGLIVLLVVLGTVVLPRPRMETPLPLDWFDFYASRDPVPNGRVDVRFWGAAAATGSGTQLAGVQAYRRESVMVFNRHSLVSDHSTYWDKDSDFTLRLLQRLLAGDEATAFDEAQCARVGAAAAARRRRLWQLAGFRAAVWIALIATLLWNRGAVSALGVAVSGHLSWMGGDGLLPHWLVARLETLSSQPLLLGGIILAVPLALTFLVGYCGWLLWDRSSSVRHLFWRRIRGARWQAGGRRLAGGLRLAGAVCGAPDAVRARHTDATRL